MSTLAARPRAWWRDPVWLGLGGILVLAPLLFILFHGRDEGPVIEGRPVMAWAADLLSPDRNQREKAELVFVKLDTNAVPALTRVLTRRDSPLRRPLLWMQDKLPFSLWRPLYRTVKPYEAEYERQIAAHALGVLGTRATSAIPALEYALRDPQPRVWQSAVQALGRIGPPAVPALVEALRDARNPARGQVCEALTGLGPAATAATPALVDLLRGTNSLLQTKAAYALGAIGPAALPPLLQLLDTGGPTAAPGVILGLEQMATASHQGMLAVIEAAKRPSVRVRLGIIQALARGAYAPRRVILALTTALADPAPAVRAQAAAALGNYAPRTQLVTNALPQLKAALQDNSESVRTEAAEAVRKIETATKNPAR